MPPPGEAHDPRPSPATTPSLDQDPVAAGPRPSRRDRDAGGGREVRRRSRRSGPSPACCTTPTTTSGPRSIPSGSWIGCGSRARRRSPTPCPSTRPSGACRRRRMMDKVPAGLRRTGGLRHRLLPGSARGHRHPGTEEREEEAQGQGVCRQGGPGDHHAAAWNCWAWISTSTSSFVIDALKPHAEELGIGAKR